ncbi:MAG: hypothetical protein LBT96_02630 [Campylobacteraceae bacterium]|jgi:hypothetical protein|nr:hypothetical protein [Campylobacteraceae bacterium]
MASSKTNFKALNLFKLKASLLSALFLGFILAGCGSDSLVDKFIPKINATAPNILAHPQSANYTKGEVADNLSVSAVSVDEGVLSYQWYKNNANFNSNGTALPNETNKTFAPPTSDAGIVYYYVVVTNTNDKFNGEKKAAIASNTAQIAVDTKTYSVSFYDDNLDLNYTTNIIGEGTIDIPQLILDNNLPISLYLANNLTDVSTNTALSVTNNINLYAIPNVQEITTQTQLAAINKDNDTLNGTYILLNDINLTSGEAGFDATLGWKPIGNDNTNYFRGIFNGNNNTITDLWINRPSGNYQGLFGYIQYAQIRNLGVEITEIKSGNYTGGIAGNVQSSSITNVYSTGNINGDYSVGGIAGIVYRSNITSSYSMGNISGNEEDVGGIAGSVAFNGNVANSYSNGSINGNRSVGGIVGGVTLNGNVANSYSTGNISGTQKVGGIVGEVIRNGNITNSYSTGNISGNEQVGGIAGNANGGNIANSYSIGNISGDNWVGGIAGRVADSTIQNNAAINPSVTGTSNVNRAIGYIFLSTVSNNFALSTMSGGDSSNSFTNSGDTSYDGTSKTDSELKAQTTYSDAISGDGFGGLGWKFGDDAANPWKIDEGNSYPYLYWQK